MADAAPLQRISEARWVVRIASPAHRNAIYGMRHSTYASELGQHPENAHGLLKDELDERNVYIVAEAAGTVAGFISVTPPGGRPIRLAVEDAQTNAREVEILSRLLGAPAGAVTT